MWPFEIGPDDIAGHRPALGATCRKHDLPRPFVVAWYVVALRDDPPPATHVPSDKGTDILRVATPGRLADLLACHQARRRPSMGFFCSYAKVEPPRSVPESRFGSLVTFELGKGGSSACSCQEEQQAAVREAVMKLSEVQPAPEILCGHTPDNAPSQQDHLAYLPLAFVDHRFADGLIRGFAVFAATHGKREVSSESLCCVRSVCLRSYGSVHWGNGRSSGSPTTIV